MRCSNFSTISGVYFQYLPTYLIGQMHFQAELYSTANVVGISAFVLGMPVWGLVRDRFGWGRTIGGAAAASMPWCRG